MPASTSRFRQIVAGCLRGMRRELVLGVACMLGTTAMTLAAPWPLKVAFDHVLLAQPLPASMAALEGLLRRSDVAALAVLSAALVAIALATAAFSFYQQFLTSRIGLRIVHALRGALFDHLQRLSLTFHRRAGAGELISKITSDTNMLRDVYSESVLNFATHGLSVLGMGAVLLWIDWKLALVVMGSFPVLFAALFLVLRRIKRAARQQRSNEGALASQVGEMLAAVPLIKAFGRERFERARFEAQNTRSIEQSLRTARIEAASTRLVEIGTALGTALVLLAGGLQALRGRISPGDLLVFVSYVANMYRPVKNIARLSARMAKAGASVERISEILQTAPEPPDAPDAIEARGLRGEIRFEHVTFGYDPARPILRDVSFTIPAGAHVALVGASGAGKSTIAHLLVRLHDPQEGRVLIDGVDVRQYRRESLRREIGLVLQDTLLFAASVRENIAYGRPDAGDDEIVQAARRAQAHEFIESLPDGYDEVLGNGGTTLSGGQRQRLCLARALLKQAPILIADEATSAADSRSGTSIRQAMRAAQRGRTLVQIAHQLDSVREADLILMLEGGRIVEQGTHDALVRQAGRYHALFQLSGQAPRGEQAEREPSAQAH